MTRTLQALLIVPLLLIAAAAPLAAQRGGGRDRPHGAAPARPELFEALIRCRAIADASARLQCFDTAAANLQNAADRREVVMVDRAQVREGRRRLFGLALPSIPIFGGGDDEEDADTVRTVEGTITTAAQNSHDQWIITLQDGAVWTQTDFNMLGNRPRSGQHVVINRGALGSYMMRVNNQPGIRVVRIR